MFRKLLKTSDILPTNSLIIKQEWLEINLSRTLQTTDDLRRLWGRCKLINGKQF